MSTLYRKDTVVTQIFSLGNLNVRYRNSISRLLRGTEVDRRL